MGAPTPPMVSPYPIGPPAPPGTKPTIPIVPVPQPGRPGPIVIGGGGAGTPPGPRVPPSDKSGATPGTDATRGLLRKPASPTGRSLLG